MPQPEPIVIVPQPIVPHQKIPDRSGGNSQQGFAQMANGRAYQEDAVVSSPLAKGIGNLTPIEIGHRLWTSYQLLDAEVSRYSQLAGAGCTASTTVYDGRGNLITATVGDAVGFAVVYDKEGNPLKVQRLNSVTHKPGDEAEVARITAAGGTVGPLARETQLQLRRNAYMQQGRPVPSDEELLKTPLDTTPRAMNYIAVSRAIGDKGVVASNGNPVICADAHIDITNINDLIAPFGDQVGKVQVISVSDGVTDPARIQSAEGHAQYLEEVLRRAPGIGNRSGEEVAKHCIAQAKKDGSVDNLSAVVNTIPVVNGIIQETEPFVNAVDDGHGHAPGNKLGGGAVSAYVGTYIGATLSGQCALTPKAYAAQPLSTNNQRAAYERDNRAVEEAALKRATASSTGARPVATPAGTSAFMPTGASVNPTQTGAPLDAPSPTSPIAAANSVIELQVISGPRANEEEEVAWRVGDTRENYNALVTRFVEYAQDRGRVVKLLGKDADIYISKGFAANILVSRNDAGLQTMWKQFEADQKLKVEREVQAMAAPKVYKEVQGDPVQLSQFIDFLKMGAAPGKEIDGVVLVNNQLNFTNPKLYEIYELNNKINNIPIDQTMDVREQEKLAHLIAEINPTHPFTAWIRQPTAAAPSSPSAAENAAPPKEVPSPRPINITPPPPPTPYVPASAASPKAVEGDANDYNAFLNFYSLVRNIAPPLSNVEGVKPSNSSTLVFTDEKLHRLYTLHYQDRKGGAMLMADRAEYQKLIEELQALPKPQAANPAPVTPPRGAAVAPTPAMGQPRPNPNIKFPPVAIINSSEAEQRAFRDFYIKLGQERGIHIPLNVTFTANPRRIECNDAQALDLYNLYGRKDRISQAQFNKEFEVIINPGIVPPPPSPDQLPSSSNQNDLDRIPIKVKYQKEFIDFYRNIYKKPGGAEGLKDMITADGQYLDFSKNPELSEVAVVFRHYIRQERQLVAADSQALNNIRARYNQPPAAAVTPPSPQDVVRAATPVTPAVTAPTRIAPEAVIPVPPVAVNRIPVAMATPVAAPVGPAAIPPAPVAAANPVEQAPRTPTPPPRVATPTPVAAHSEEEVKEFEDLMAREAAMKGEAIRAAEANRWRVTKMGDMQCLAASPHPKKEIVLYRAKNEHDMVEVQAAFEKHLQKHDEGYKNKVRVLSGTSPEIFVAKNKEGYQLVISKDSPALEKHWKQWKDVNQKMIEEAQKTRVQQEANAPGPDANKEPPQRMTPQNAQLQSSMKEELAKGRAPAQRARDCIQEARDEYILHNLHKGGMWHGRKGRMDAENFNNQIQAGIKNLSPNETKEQAIHRVLFDYLDNGPGNTRPHSFKTALLQKFLNEYEPDALKNVPKKDQLKYVSEHFDALQGRLRSKLEGQGQMQVQRDEPEHRAGPGPR